MRHPKIIIGQSDSVLSRTLDLATAGADFEIHIAEKGDRVAEMARLGAAPDLVVLDIALQGPDAASLCHAFKQDPYLTETPILIIDSAGDGDHAALLAAGCDDILSGALHHDTLMARIRSLIRLKAITDQRDDAEAILYTLARTIEAKDPYTMGHADRVAQYGVKLGKHMGVSAYDAQILRQGGMLHDIGKLAIPDAILLKPGRYTPEEFSVMKRHPTLGCDICGKLRSVRDALPLIRHHHEKLDGSGYPDGLRQDAIPPLVRIVSIVDIYDALRSQRSYKEAFTVDKSFEIMWQEVEKGWWDRTLLSAWEALIRSSRKAANA